jgi:hypothetical protein
VKVDFEASSLNVLAVDLAGAGPEAVARSGVELAKSAQRVQDMARDLAPRGHLPHYAATITWDASVDGLDVEIGPDRQINGQAKLAHILEYGSVNNAPFAHLGPAFDREVPDLVEHLADAAGRTL